MKTEGFLSGDIERLLFESKQPSGFIDGYFPHEYLCSTDKERYAYRLAFLKHQLDPANGSAFVLKESGVVAGLGFLSRLDWDSDYYGHEIYTLAVFFNARASEEKEKAFISSIIDICRAMSRIRQVVVTLSGAKNSTFLTLESLGFKHRGHSKTLYVSKSTLSLCMLRGERSAMVVDGSVFPLDEIAALACCINFPSRIYQESLCCPDLVRQMHGHWIRQISSREMADRSMKIFVRDGRAVGLAASELLSLPSDSENIRVFGRTLFGFLPGQAHHAIDSLLCSGLQDALGKCEVIESTVSESNHVTIRMLLRVGHKLGRTNHTMSLIL